MFERLEDQVKKLCAGCMKKQALEYIETLIRTADDDPGKMVFIGILDTADKGVLKIFVEAQG